MATAKATFKVIQNQKQTSINAVIISDNINDAPTVHLRIKKAIEENRWQTISYKKNRNKLWQPQTRQNRGNEIFSSKIRFFNPQIETAFARVFNVQLLPLNATTHQQSP
jgi:hypothetical protein